MTRSEDTSSLIGTWVLEGRNDEEPASRIARFENDGSLVYTISDSEHEVVVRLTWSVEGGELVTRDHPSGGEVRSQIRFDGSDLVLDFGGKTFRYLRADA